MGREEDQVNKRTPWWKRLWGWTGFGEKKLWNWLELLSTLAIPVVLALASYWFAAHQDERQREIEDQRAQDTALQAYLDQMSTLLLNKDLSDDKVRTLARARTLTVLARLDPSRKTEVMRFLMEASLVQVEKCCKEPVIDLNRATLSDLNLLYARLERAHLNSADLSSANLRGAELAYAHLESARLTGADLGDAELNYAELNYADLSNADLGGADLGGADLSDADLSDADLRSADLSDADLSNADLGGAKGVTKELLEAQAETLSGATMPDGQKMPLEPEPYVTAEFEPAFRYEVGEGWAVYQDSAHVLVIGDSEGGQLIFTSPLHVFDPSNPSEPKVVSMPENADEWASWFQRHPNLDTSEPIPVSVGGASGVRIDVTLSSTPENYPRDLCGEQPCVPLYPGIGSVADSKDRFIILDFEGETVVIDVGAPADKFDEFLPKAQEVLDTVEWTGAQHR